MFAIMDHLVPVFRAQTLPSGVRIRVRLPHRSDHLGLVALAERAGAPLAPLEARRLLRFDPRAEAAVSVTAWADGAERLVGFAVAAPEDEPAAFLVDEDHAPGLAPLMRRALRERLARVA
jgi:hypothetical protein